MTNMRYAMDKGALRNFDRSLRIFWVLWVFSTNTDDTFHATIINHHLVCVIVMVRLWHIETQTDWQVRFLVWGNCSQLCRDGFTRLWVKSSLYWIVNIRDRITLTSILNNTNMVWQEWQEWHSSKPKLAECLVKGQWSPSSGHSRCKVWIFQLVKGKHASSVELKSIFIWSAVGQNLIQLRQMRWSINLHTWSELNQWRQWSHDMSGCLW